jgi:hypothetical protein
MPAVGLATHKSTKLIRPAFTALLLIGDLLPANCAQAADQSPAPQLSEVTVIAPRQPTAQELSGKAVPNFVRSHSTPSTVIGQITRWRNSICPLTLGLDPARNAFVTARILAVAATIGAPHDDSSTCKPNVKILFTLEPQQVLEEAVKKDSRVLGFHYQRQQKRLMTFSRPIQSWYVTSTRNYRGVEAVDDPLPLGGAQEGFIGTPNGYFPGSRVPPGEPGSRLTNLRSSQIVSALIVVDANKVNGMTIGSVSDYLAVLTLSQAKSPDTCSQLPSIMDLMASTCDNRDKVTQVTAGDLAFLRALYKANLEQPLNLETSDIENNMMRQFARR